MWVFRSLKKRNSTNDLIYLHSSRKIAHSSTTGKYDLLCADCDSKLGKELDDYAKKWVSQAHNKTSIIDTDPLKLSCFMASVFWRASLSQHWTYQEFLSKQIDASSLLKRATYNKREAFKIGTYSLERIVNPSKVLSRSDLRNIIIFPYTQLLHSGNTERPTLLLRMAFEGFIWNMAIPRVSHTHLNKGNFLRPEKGKYTPARKNIFNDPEIMDKLMGAYGKNISGYISKRLLKKRDGEST